MQFWPNLGRRGFRLFENKFSSSEFELFKTEIFEHKQKMNVLEKKGPFIKITTLMHSSVNHSRIYIYVYIQRSN